MLQAFSSIHVFTAQMVKISKSDLRSSSHNFTPSTINTPSALRYLSCLYLHSLFNSFFDYMTLLFFCLNILSSLFEDFVLRIWFARFSSGYKKMRQICCDLPHCTTFSTFSYYSAYTSKVISGLISL